MYCLGMMKEMNKMGRLKTNYLALEAIAGNGEEKLRARRIVKARRHLRTSFGWESGERGGESFRQDAV